MPGISKRVVDAATAGKTRKFIWDSRLSGFGLVVQKSGLKSYCFQYRTPEGQTRRIGIGRHGDPWTPESARNKAKELANDVAAGRDPMQEKRDRLNALTVGDLLDRYLDSPAFAEKTAATQANDRGRVIRHLKPQLGRKVADKLDADDVRKAFANITAGKTAATVKTKARGLARVTGGEGAARMAIRLLRAAYSWAISVKLMKTNPAADVAIGTDGNRDAIIESADQYAALFKTLTRLENEHSLRRPVADAIRVLALTGARRGEIAGARWRHVDLKNGVLRLEVKEHKTGKKTGKPRIIGLPAAAQAIIAQQPEGQPGDFVFRPTKGAGMLSLSKPWRAIRKAAGLREDIGLHGLRHTLATNMALDGAQAAQLMTVLGHRSLSTSQKYIHVSQDKRAQLAEHAAAGVSAALLKGEDASAVESLNGGAKRGRHER